MLSAIISWRPRPPFYYGWLVLGAVTFGAFAAAGITQIVLGGVQNLIFEDMGWNRSTIAYAVTAGTWTAGLLTPFFGKLADRYGSRQLMPLAVLIVGICFFALSGTQAIWHFYAAVIVARSVHGPVLIGVVPRTAVVNFFRKKRSLVLGLSAMAAPVGGAIGIQVISLVAQAYSWRVAYRGLGVFALALVAPLFVILRRRPEDIGLRIDGHEIPIQDASNLGNPRTIERNSMGLDESDWSAREAAVTPAYWLIIAANSMVLLTWGTVAFQVVPYLKDAGLSQTVAATAWSLSTLFGAGSNLLYGYLADKFAPRRMAIFALIATVAATSLFLFVDSGRWGFFLVVLWGVTCAGLNILNHMIMAQYFGRTSFGSIAGLMATFETGAVGLGPTLGAVLFNLGQGYVWLFVYAVGAYLLALVLIYAARTPRPPGRLLVQDNLVTEE